MYEANSLLNNQHLIIRQKPSARLQRQKRKILPSDNLSIEKDFPRFYAKCRNRRTSDGNSDSQSESESVDNGFTTADEDSSTTESRSASPRHLTSDTETSMTKPRLCRLIEVDPMRSLLNDRNRLSSLTVEIHKLNKRFENELSQKLRIQSDANNNNALTNQFNEQSKMSLGNQSPLVKRSLKKTRNRNIERAEAELPRNRIIHTNNIDPDCTKAGCDDDTCNISALSELRLYPVEKCLSDSGYSSNHEDVETKGVGSDNFSVNGENFGKAKECTILYCNGEEPTQHVSHQPETVVIKIKAHDQIELPEIQQIKRPLSRCTIKINSGKRLNEAFDYFSAGSFQTFTDKCIQTENVTNSPVACGKMKGSDRLSCIEVVLVQDSWLMVAESSYAESSGINTSGKVPDAIFCHKKCEEQRGRWLLMQEVLSENRKLLGSDTLSVGVEKK